LAYQFYPAVMHSAQRFTYDTVWEILSNSKGPEAARFAQFRPLLSNLYSLYKILLAAREKRGAIEFETTETQIISNELGKILRIEPRIRNDAHRLIEDFMILANVAAAEILERAQVPLIYRVHDEPSAEKRETLRAVLADLGTDLPKGERLTPMQFNRILENSVTPNIRSLSMRLFCVAKRRRNIRHNPSAISV